MQTSIYSHGVSNSHHQIMAKQSPGKHKTGFEGWQAYVNGALSNPEAWNAHDCDIKIAVTEFNRHLAGVMDYRSLDWRLIKAMTWVETGAGKPAWKRNPIQIGNPGDPGLKALLGDQEGGDLILPSAMKSRLSPAAVMTIPSYNIRAGIGYLLMRLANFSTRSVPDSDGRIYEVTAKAGDSLDLLARKNDSTTEMLKTLNPAVHVLRPGRVIKYRKAAMRRIIVGWKQVTTGSIYKYYNVGDPRYAQKLDYALALINKGKAAICSQ